MSAASAAPPTTARVMRSAWPSSMPPPSGDGAMSEANRASRATTAPDSGTITSRGPAARKSGTSKPAVRRRMLGTPSSKRMFWISSASAWLRPPAIRTSGPRVSSGRILRARSWASSRAGSSCSPPRCTSGMPQSEQKRSSASCSSPQSGHTSGTPGSWLDGDVLFLHAPVDDAPGPHARLSRERHDHVAPVRVVGEVDVGLRRLRRALRVRVVDHDLVALVVELVRRQQAARVDLVAVRRRAHVLGAEDLLDAAVSRPGVAAALVGGVVARVRHELVPVRLRDDHRIKAISRTYYQPASRRQLMAGSLAAAAGALVASCGGSNSKSRAVETVSTTEAESDAAVLGALLDQEYSSIAAYTL